MQSEALPIRRALVTDDLLSRSEMAHKALMGGVRAINGYPRLILKLKVRKNIRYRTIQMRPCFCDGGVLLAKGNCPVHHSWPSISRRVAPVDLLFPSLHRENLNRTLKASLTTLATPEAHGYTDYCFRRGAVMEMKGPGKTLAQIMATAG